MADLDVLKDVVRASSELSKKGQHGGALRLIDDATASARRENRPRWVKILNQHAAAISRSAGDLALVRHYCEQVVNCDPKDPLARYALADVLHRQGEIELAKQQAVESYKLIRHSKSEQDRGLVELILKNWPDIASW